VQARIANDLRAETAPPSSERPTIPAPAYAACRASAMRAQVAYEMLLEDRLAALNASARPTLPAPSGDVELELDWSAA
jgi:hypothetical protein